MPRGDEKGTLQRVPWQRSTLYTGVSEERRAASFAAAPLTDVVNAPVRRADAATRRAGLIAREPATACGN